MFIGYNGFIWLYSGINVILFTMVRTGVAQLVEQRSPKPCVGGSSPSAGAKNVN